MGTLGTLTKAKQNHFIPEIKPLLNDMIATAGYWINKELYNQVLADAGE
ncbi:MAG TPA: DUF3368 domain-containing protein [Chitinophagales bacterium]|nr:DUF3368 domain-containing protein [Chitinophagales bacterium]